MPNLKRRYADGGLGALSSELEPQYPEWLQKLGQFTGRATKRIGTTPYTGGPPIDPEALVPTPASTVTDLAALALPPAVKLVKGAAAAKTGLEAAGLGRRLLATEQAEGIPGVGVGHFESMINAAPDVKKKFHEGVTAAFQGKGNLDRLYRAVGLKTKPPREAIGAWRPEGQPIEVNPVSSIPVKVPMQGKGLYPSARAQIEAILALKGGLTAQNAQAMNAVRKQAMPGNAAQLLLGKQPVTRSSMQTLMNQFPHLDFGHTGSHLNAFNFADNAKLTDVESDALAQLTGATKWVRGESIGPYVEFSKEWAKQPGSGAVTAKMFEHIRKLPPKAYAKLDRAIREPVGQLYSFYASQPGTSRADLMNLLQIIRDKGLTGAEAALKSGQFLPGVVGAMIAPSMLSRKEPERPL